MPKLKYKSINIPYLSGSPILLLSDIDNTNRNSLTLSISSDEYSHVLIEGKTFRLRGGTVEIAFNDIATGISDVVFIKGTQKICASPFLINDRLVERVPLDSNVLKLIEDLLISLAEGISAAKKRILALEEKINPKNMFNFT